MCIYYSYRKNEPRRGGNLERALTHHVALTTKGYPMNTTYQRAMAALEEAETTAKGMQATADEIVADMRKVEPIGQIKPKGYEAYRRAYYQSCW